jgi:hypothetical protein
MPEQQIEGLFFIEKIIREEELKRIELERVKQTTEALKR